MLGSAQGVSDRSDPWSVYNFMLAFFERIRAVAIANVSRIDVLALYIETSVDQACRILWSIVQMDPGQFPYMPVRDAVGAADVIGYPEVPELHLFTDLEACVWWLTTRTDSS